MDLPVSPDQLRFLLRRVRERLWVRPVLAVLASLTGVALARAVGGTEVGDALPEVSPESVETLLSVMASSMLVIATFAVASMVAAYQSASTTATPRAFTLVVADDASQNALSTFIGAFIFSIVGLTAAKNQAFDAPGRFALFVLTVAVFALVIFVFVQWVDRIARLGRMAPTLDAVEAATARAFAFWRAAPTLGGVPVPDTLSTGDPVFATRVGYVQHVDVEALQEAATAAGRTVRVEALPGAFVGPGRPLATLLHGSDAAADPGPFQAAFLVGASRVFDEDPRFGLIVLAEIADRALSPAVNDPGTAIDVLVRAVRLFVGWRLPGDTPPTGPRFDCVQVPALDVRDLFDDAFTAIARDGAGTIEVALRLQAALATLAATGDPAFQEAAQAHARLALGRAERALALPEDWAWLRRASPFSAGEPGEPG
ncbi:MAG: DUF2254 domain-containing protein [Alphaproteobacteria bacterium]|nr:DUF2254 domain-containing protein [Alphaproteobacteria bacterium]